MRKIDRTQIKLAIAEATSTTRHNRVEASKNFSAAGKLLTVCFATGTNPSNEYYTLHSAGLKHKVLADYRQHRRSLTLAAAFLNNTPYSRCEPNTDTENLSPSAIAGVIAAAIDNDPDVTLEAWHRSVRQIIETWLKSPTLTRHDLMPDTIPECFRAPMAEAA